jgi:hypothetical protein
MSWLTWRQFRANVLVIYAAVAVIAVGLAVTGPSLAELARATGADFIDAFLANQLDSTLYYAGIAALLALPAVIGAFWGAPLVARELEAGTHQLSWNQSVTRTRWLAVKLAVTAGTAIVATGILSLAVSWWSSTVDMAVASGQPSYEVASRLSPAIFDARGITPIGYTAFAIALGVTAGAMLRRTVRAIAVTLVVFLAVQLSWSMFVRAELLTPQQDTRPITEENLVGLSYQGSPGATAPVLEVKFDKPDAWVVSERTVDATGQVVATLPLNTCAEPAPATGAERVPAAGKPGSGACMRAYLDQLRQLGYQQRLTYHPGSRFWTFQWLETAIFFGFALLLSTLCFWWVRRRLS